MLQTFVLVSVASVVSGYPAGWPRAVTAVWGFWFESRHLPSDPCEQYITVTFCCDVRLAGVSSGQFSVHVTLLILADSAIHRTDREPNGLHKLAARPTRSINQMYQPNVHFSDSAPQSHQTAACCPPWKAAEVHEDVKEEVIGPDISGFQLDKRLEAPLLPLPYGQCWTWRVPGCVHCIHGYAQWIWAVISGQKAAGYVGRAPAHLVFVAAAWSVQTVNGLT